MIDTLITASLWAGLAYLAVGFIAYTIKRSRNAVPPISQIAEPEATASEVTTDPVAEAIEQIEVAFSDVIVPFKRPLRQYSDLALIRMAKSIKYPGASKWSYNRKLSQVVRDELLLLARKSA